MKIPLFESKAAPGEAAVRCIAKGAQLPQWIPLKRRKRLSFIPVLTELGNKPAGEGPNAVNGCCGSDVQGFVVLVSPCQVGGLLGGENRSQVMSLRIPHPYTLRSHHKQVSGPIDAHSVWDTVFGAIVFIAEDAAVGKRPAGMKVIYPDVALLAVVDIQQFPIRGKGQAVGLSQILGEQPNAAILAEPVDALKGDFLRLTFRQIERRVREIDGLVRADNQVIRAVKPFSLKPIGKNGIPPVGRNANDGPQDACTVQKLVVGIVGVAIRIAKCDDGVAAPIQINPVDFVLHFIADVQEIAAIPNRPFGESESRRYSGEPGVVGDKLPELRRERLERGGFRG